VLTAQKLRLPLSDEQVMDCALAERGAIAISATTPKTGTRNFRIRIRNSPRRNATWKLWIVIDLLRNLRSTAPEL
jgi:hypothetical protein